MARILNLVVVALLIAAAVGVYKVKYESTLQAEQVARLRGEIRREKDAIAQLRAEWSRLSRPDRIQTLAGRHTPLKPLDLTRLDRLDQLPDKPPPPGDPIGDMLDALERPADTGDFTGTIPLTGAFR